jgi:hypothetical protein
MKHEQERNDLAVDVYLIHPILVGVVIGVPNKGLKFGF